MDVLTVHCSRYEGIKSCAAVAVVAAGRSRAVRKERGELFSGFFGTSWLPFNTSAGEQESHLRRRLCMLALAMIVPTR